MSDDLPQSTTLSEAKLHDTTMLLIDGYYDYVTNSLKEALPENNWIQTL